MAEKKVTIYIPIDPLNPQIKTLDVIYNFKTYKITRNDFVEVPEEVAKIAQEHLKRTAELEVSINTEM